MPHPYLPHTPEDIAAMCARIGISSPDELFADIPRKLRYKGPYKLDAALTEDEIRDFFNRPDTLTPRDLCLLGMGWYVHSCPSVVPYIAQRSEFLTSYTPYQPEISQGTLQYIFEYQSMMCELTGLDVSNASMYDGSTAMAEAMMMCVAATRKRHRVIVSGTVYPHYLEVMKTYARYHGVDLTILGEEGGVTDFGPLDRELAKGDVAGVILQTPNLFGILEDFTGIAERVHAAKALLVISTPASALGVLKTPAAWGADIAAGDAQSLGMPLNFGGPGLGYLCCTKALMRKLPGRIVGATTDAEGHRCFVLTLQAREQHIRRDKATSNICSNQGVMTLWAAMYLALMGASGLREVNRQSCNGAHYFRTRLCETGLFEEAFPGTTFLNEFTVRYKGDMPLDDLLELLSFSPGVSNGEDLLTIAVNETQSQETLNMIVEMIKLAAK